jgi:hypothetical protein
MAVLDHRGCRWGIWLDLCGREGHLPSQRGLQRSYQPATGHLLQPDALRAASLPSLAPLGIGDSWYRFVGRVALSKVGDRVGSALSPVQLGIGVKNGAEIGGRMA